MPALFALVFAGVGVLPQASADTLCSGNTGNDLKDCAGQCPGGHIIRVSMTLNDKDEGNNAEAGAANTTCSNQDAGCAIAKTGPRGCSANSPGPTAAPGGWACHFEAHDVWWQPDSGFQYNCASFAASGGGGLNTFESIDGPALCGGGGSTFAVEAQWEKLCNLFADPSTGIFLADADVQMFGLVEAGSAAGIACASEGCWALPPLCVETPTGPSCVVSPDRPV